MQLVINYDTWIWEGYSWYTKDTAGTQNLLIKDEVSYIIRDDVLPILKCLGPIVRGN